MTHSFTHSPGRSVTAPGPGETNNKLPPIPAPALLKLTTASSARCTNGAPKLNWWLEPVLGHACWQEARCAKILSHIDSGQTFHLGPAPGISPRAARAPASRAKPAAKEPEMAACQSVHLPIWLSARVPVQ